MPRTRAWSFLAGLVEDEMTSESCDLNGHGADKGTALLLHDVLRIDHHIEIGALQRFVYRGFALTHPWATAEDHAGVFGEFAVSGPEQPQDGPGLRNGLQRRGGVDHDMGLDGFNGHERRTLCELRAA